MKIVLVSLILLAAAPSFAMPTKCRGIYKKLNSSESREAAMIFVKTLKNEEDRYRAAKYIVTDRADTGANGPISVVISNFNLSSDHRFEIAKIAAEEDGYIFANHFQDFMLDTEEQRFEAAQILLKSTSAYLVEISDLDIKSEDLRYQLALIAVKYKDEKGKYGQGPDFNVLNDFKLTRPHIVEAAKQLIKYSHNWTLGKSLIELSGITKNDRQDLRWLVDKKFPPEKKER